jgi:hypothetical protein
MAHLQGSLQYVAGLSLGPASDYTALAALEKAYPRRVGDESQYAVRYLERFPPGTPYARVCDRARELFKAPPLAGGRLVADITAVGKPVLKLLQRAKIGGTVSAVTVGGGHQAAFDRGGWVVPRVELVSTLQLLLQSRRLQVAPALSEAETLAEELVRFRPKVTAPTADLLDAWRDGPHDDLVLAVAVAAWRAERYLGPEQAYAPYAINIGRGWRWQ